MLVFARYRRMRHIEFESAGAFLLQKLFQGETMKKILIVIALSGMLIPTIASAELNYNAVNVGYAKVSQTGWADLTGYDFGVSYGITKNVFLEGSYGTGSQPSGTTLGDITVSGFDVGAGYHTPIQNDVDFIVGAHLIQGTAKFAGLSYNSNGYDVGVGIRAELTPKFEAILSGVHTNVTSNSSTTTSNGMQAEVGFKVTPEVQLLAGIASDSNSPQTGSSYTTQTIHFGARFYY